MNSHGGDATGQDKVKPVWPVPIVKGSDPANMSDIKEKFNDLIEAINELHEENKALKKRLDLTDGALMKLLTQFSAHTHNKIGLCAVPPS